MRRLLTLALIAIFASTAHAQNTKYEKEYAAINEKGEILFKFWAKAAYDFQNGLARVKKYVIVGNKAYYNYGFMDTSGKLVVPCEYEKVKDFIADVTFVKKRGDEGWMLINKKGEPVSSKRFFKVSNFYDGPARFTVKDKYYNGYVNQKGEVVIPPNYVGGHFSEGLVCLSKAGSGEAYGFMNEQGEVAIPFQYRQAGASSFEDGLCRVKISSKTALINKEGEVVVPGKYPTLNCVNAKEKVMAVSSGGFTNFKFVDFDYKPLFEGTFDGVKPFKGGRAVVSNSLETSGLVDKEGNFVIPMAKQDLINDLDENGYVKVMRDKTDSEGNFIEREYLHLDKDGKPWARVPTYTIGDRGGNGFYKYKDPETKLFGYLNAEGEKIIEPQFERASEFNKDGLAIVRLVPGK